MKDNNNTIKKTTGKIHIRLLGFTIIFLISYLAARIAVYDSSASTRLSLHEFYQQSNIDMAVIGPSTVYNGFDPMLADSILSINTFNMGTASQSFDGAYYYLKELIRNYHPDTVFFDVEFSFLSRPIGQKQSSWIISDYMKAPTKYEYILDISEPEDYPVFFSVLYRDKKDISFEFCKNNICAKLNTDYITYKAHNDYYTNYNNYIGKGLANEEKELFQYDFPCVYLDDGFIEQFNIKDINEEMMSYLYKSIELCQENDINIVLFSMPQTDIYIRNTGNYDGFIKYINDIAISYNVPYYNFNLLTSDCFDQKEFKNLDHFNLVGADHFTKLLCRLYQDEDSLSFADSLDGLNKTDIYGIIYKTRTENGLYDLDVQIQSYSDIDTSIIVKEYLNDEIIYQSKMLRDNHLSWNKQNDSSLIIEVYDGNNNYIGNGFIE